MPQYCQRPPEFPLFPLTLPAFAALEVTVPLPENLTPRKPTHAMISRIPKTGRYLALAASLLFNSAAHAQETLYATDFSEFTAGPDQLAGQHGWSGSHENQGLHGIDEDIYVGRERSAFLGGTSPADRSDFVQVYHTIDPVQKLGSPLSALEFDVLFGVAASFEGGYDTFSFSFYSDAGEPLASIHFDTSEFDYGIWIDDSAEIYDTSESFLTDFLHHLQIKIDLKANLWEAELDGIAIFDSRPFTALASNDVSLAIGALAAEWRIADPQDPGDNWLLFDDWTVSGMTDTIKASVPTAVDIVRGDDGQLELLWAADAGARYQVHASPDGRVWTAVGDPVSTGAEDRTTHFTLPISNTSPGTQLYRVEPLDLQP